MKTVTINSSNIASCQLIEILVSVYGAIGTSSYPRSTRFTAPDKLIGTKWSICSCSLVNVIGGMGHGR